MKNAELSDINKATDTAELGMQFLAEVNSDHVLEGDDETCSEVIIFVSE